MQYANNIYQLPLWFKSPLDQLIKRNFTSNPVHLTEDGNNQPARKDIDLSIKSKEVADSLPVASDDLDSGKKFDEEIQKANFPDGAEGEAKVNEIVDKILTERAAVVEKMTTELETLKKKDVQDSIDKRTFGEISGEEHIKELAGISSFYEEQIREHHNSCDKELRELMEVVFAYKKDNDMPLQNSSDIDSSTDMPGPMDDE